MELLAPAGTPSSLYAAVAAGADAVYFGLGELNARAKAQGFDEGNVKDLIDYCHLHGVKCYITLNTMIKTGEKGSLARLANAAAAAGADAFIVADIGVARALSHLDVPLHASTQMGVHNLEGAKYLERYGFTRVVVARETLLEDVRKIKQNTSLEVEYFVHGALCVAFSGACLMSAVRSGDSGNRGRCLQPCRMRYQSSFGKSGYLLSPSDQCLIARLEELKAAGVDSLKIEGRLKQPHYVYTAVTEYRSALGGKAVSRKDIDELQRAFNRGNFSEGYNFADTRALMYPKVQSNIGVNVGEVVSASGDAIKVALTEAIRKGDGLKILTKDGAERGGFEAREDCTRSVAKLTVPKSLAVEKGDVLAKTLDTSRVSAAVTMPVPIPVSVAVKAVSGQPFEIEVRAGEISATASGAPVQSAKSHPLDGNGLAIAVDRFGASGFAAKKIDVECGEGVFVPASEINAVRREACAKLKEAILSQYRAQQRRARISVPYQAEKLALDSLFEVGDIDDADADVLELAVAPSSFTSEDAKHLKTRCIERGKKVYLRLPMVVRGADMRVLRGYLDDVDEVVKGYICDNWYAFELAREYGKPSIASQRMNIASDDAFLACGANAAIASAELSYPEYRALGFDALCYVFGELTLMTLTHCPVQLSTGCNCGDCKYTGDFYYRDKAAEYRISRTKLVHCTFDLHNPSLVCAPSKFRDGARRFVSLVGTRLKLSQYLADPNASGRNKTAGLLSRGVK